MRHPEPCNLVRGGMGRGSCRMGGHSLQRGRSLAPRMSATLSSLPKAPPDRRIVGQAPNLCPCEPQRHLVRRRVSAPVSKGAWGRCVSPPRAVVRMWCVVANLLPRVPSCSAPAEGFTRQLTGSANQRNGVGLSPLACRRPNSTSTGTPRRTGL